MTVESATYLSQLNATYPVTDGKVYEGDDHIRLLKTAILNSLGSISGTVSATHTELNYLAGVAAGTVSASKALVCGATKNLDELTVATFTATTATITAINGTPTITNPTVVTPVLNGSVSGTGVLDEDDMSSDSATALATQQSIKAYTDAVAGNILIVEDRKTSGTAGGTATGSTWNDRALNTVVHNGITGASVDTGTGQVTLPAGTYEVRGGAPAYECEGHVTRLYNVTDAGALTDGNGNVVLGNAASADDSALGASTSSNSDILSVFTLAAEKAIKLQHYVNSTKSTAGLGVAVSIAGVEEIYAHLEFRKL